MSESLESTAALARARTCDTRHSGRWEAAEGHRVHEVLAWTIHLICEDAHITEGALRIQGGVAGAPALSADACGRVEAVKWCRGRSKSDVCGTGDASKHCKGICLGFAQPGCEQLAHRCHLMVNRQYYCPPDPLLVEARLRAATVRVSTVAPRMISRGSPWPE